MFNPTDTGIRSVALTISNNDLDENPYAFSIHGSGIASDIGILGNSNNIADNDSTPLPANHTDYGYNDIDRETTTYTYLIYNSGNATLNLVGTPIVQIGGSNASEFGTTTFPSSSIPVGENSTFSIEFDPISEGLRVATISLQNNDPDESPYNFMIQGTGVYRPAEASFMFPGSVNYHGPSSVPEPFRGYVASNPNGTTVAPNSTTILLQRISDNKYWNGDNWTISAYWLSTTHDASEGGTQIIWTRGINIDPWPLDIYLLTARAVDISGVSFTGDTILFTVTDCFIATAAYGTPLAEELDVLRNFRDTVLLRNEFGSWLVSQYYRFSPRAGSAISKHEVSRIFIREAIIKPIVRLVQYFHPVNTSSS